MEVDLPSLVSSRLEIISSLLLASPDQPVNPTTVEEIKLEIQQKLLTVNNSFGSNNYSSSSSSLSVARLIDHTLLAADATPTQIHQLCKEAVDYSFYSVCVNPSNLSLAKQSIQAISNNNNSNNNSLSLSPRVCVVIGFPLGANTSFVKSVEAKSSVEAGADELDMVMNIGALKSKQYQLVKNDIKAVVEAVREAVVNSNSIHSTVPLVKVILETALLTKEEIIDASILSFLAGASFIKTSTGFSSAGGATIDAVGLMRAAVGKGCQVKASGGIRDWKTAEKMIQAGADRLGTSASIAIVKGQQTEQSTTDRNEIRNGTATVTVAGGMASEAGGKY